MILERVPCCRLVWVIGVCAFLQTSMVLAHPEEEHEPGCARCLAKQDHHERPRRVMSSQLTGVFDSLGVELLAQVPLADFPGNSSLANDIWGYVSPAGREYAIIGLRSGVGFVEITDPRNPVVVDVIASPGSTWGDMATFGTFAYHVNESGGGMQIIDLSMIDENLVGLVGSAEGNLTTAHNVFVNAESGFAYATDTNLNTFGGGFIVYDLSDPSNPQQIASWGGTSAHDVYVTSYADCPYAGRAGQACEIVFSFAGSTGMAIIDVTNKMSMQLIAIHTYPNKAFCHQGWPSEDRQFMFFGDEVDELNFGIPTTGYVVDISDLANPVGLPSFTNGLQAIDHNLMVRGSHLFRADYVNGLRIFDVSDVPNIQEVGFFDTSVFGDGRTFAGAWGVYSDFPSGVVLISDEQGGLFILDVADAVGCQSAAQCNDGDACTDDSCSAAGQCVFTPLGEGAPCDDLLACTVGDLCNAAGICQGTDVTTLVCNVDGDCPAGRCGSQIGFCACTECAVIDAPTIAADMVASPRYLSFSPGFISEPVAIRVIVDQLPPPFEEFEGSTFWVGDLFELSEIPSLTDTTAPTFLAARLVCAPVILDLSSVDAIRLVSQAIVPDATYKIQVIAQSCIDSGEPIFSMALLLETSIWGDIVENCSQIPCSAPEGSADLATDVVSMLAKFKGLLGAPIKSRADISPGSPDFLVDLGDVVFGLDAFKGIPYPFAWPDLCP